MKTKGLKKVFSAFIALVMVFQVQSIIAAGEPLLLLAYEDIDDDHFVVNVTLSDMPKFSALELPIAFNTESVKICGYDAQTGAFSEISDGKQDSDDIIDGLCGLVLSQEILSTDMWGGSILSNDRYPYISNSEGILKIVLYTLNGKEVFKEEGKLCSVYFEKIGTESPEIRIATKKNAKFYDSAAPMGALFAEAGEYLNVAWRYDGDVFEDNSKIVLPKFEDDTDDTEKDTKDTDKSKDTDSINKGNNSSKGGNSQGGSSDVEKTEHDDTDSHSEALVFVDVDDSHWAKEYIYDLANKKIINGYEDSTFKPQENITRAELATLASVAKGFQTDDNEVIFTDSNSTVWYNRYLTAGYKNHIIEGYPGGEFRPQNNITRQDLCVIMYRMYFADVNSEYELSYSDSDEISEYAKEAVKALSEKGILSGRGHNEFAPKAYATRAEVAKVLYSCMN